MDISQHTINEFQQVIWDYYHEHYRNMPWRENPSPYWVMVSEIMLQQTQVDRVRPKFLAFIEQFSTSSALAAAPLSEVIAAWSGLGYNRRAKFLWQAAQMIDTQYSGHFPSTLDELQKLPGIGPNTAAAILAYAFNEPVVFIETNIRTVLFHHFFADHPDSVTDAQLREIATQVLEPEHPREWYWALMDYGTYLKRSVGGRLTQSKHYKKQSPFTGSVREMRGRILRALVSAPLSAAELQREVLADERYAPALEALLGENMVCETAAGYLSLTDRA